MAKVVELSAALKNNPEAAKLLVPSARFEIYLDLTGDGKANLGLIDSSCDLTGNGNLDTYAVDLGNDGEFDLYLRDNDGNMVADEIVYFKDGEKEPLLVTHPEKSGNMIEAALAAPSKKLLGAIAELAQGKIAADDFKKNMGAWHEEARAALKALFDAYQKSKK
ncbi:MAG: hypothetical protein J6N15_02200 [Ruminiclostridium sp.]|nr:hypothetical protein [Ruminiclostridium sp.]